MPPELKNQSLVEGAFFAALTTLVALLGLYVPPLYPVAGLAGPLPLAVLVCRRDLRTGVLALLVAAVLLFFLFGRPLTVLVLVIDFGPLGLLLGLLYKRRTSAGLSVAAAGVAAALLTLVTALITFRVTGINPFVTGPEMRRSMEQVLAWYQQHGMLNAAAGQQLKQAMDQALHLMSTLLPANLIVWSLVSAGITYMLGRLVLKRLGFKVVPLPPLHRWQLPWYMIWTLIPGLSLLLAGESPGQRILMVLAENLLFVAGFVYLIAGVSVTAFYIRRWARTRLFKYLLLFLIVLYLPYALVALCTLGLSDSLLNIRRLSGPAKGEDKK
ncbi:YybS family protein [Desulfotomaculum copahuensis]|uniref:DUF2232 domain-containing protein n=1 Tax=Desulfotomaculum copahuensis TaxID=1838280 RepID=A0A1B7LD54_9FIRM|nr:YybS family protein [Desulfotomaculum copahuensis]OAT80866.1 hypothetical protein A6M21_12415 [Desulfotomaculum copahuensis]